MKITKQTAYRHTVAQRAMRMEEIVAWVRMSGRGISLRSFERN